jgi:WD40 repeat protein
VASDEQLELRDPRTLVLKRTFTGHNGALLGFAVVGPERDIVWTAGRDGSAIAYDLTGTRGMLRTRPRSGPLWVGDADDAGRIAIQTPYGETEPNSARMLDVTTGEDLYGDLRHRRGCLCQVAAVDMAGDGSLAVGIIDELNRQNFAFAPRNNLAVWNPDDGSLRHLPRLPWRATGLALSPDGARVVVNGAHEYGMLDVGSGEIEWERQHPTDTDWLQSMPQAGFSPNGTTVALLRGETVLVADAATGDVVAERKLPDARTLLQVAWGPDSATVVLGSITGRLYFLDAATLEPVAPQRLLTGGFVIDLEVEPEGTMLAAMGSDGDVTLFDTTTWRPYGKPVTDGLGWGFLSFSSENTLRIFSELGSVTTIGTDPAEWVDRACEVANRNLSDEESEVIRPGEPNTPACR